MPHELAQTKVATKSTKTVQTNDMWWDRTLCVSDGLADKRWAIGTCDIYYEVYRYRLQSPANLKINLNSNETSNEKI